MPFKTFIVIKTQFEAIHNWPDCGIESVSYLRNPHRHIFHVEMKWIVEGLNRDIEFIDQKHKVDDFIHKKLAYKNIGAMSCEMIASRLMTKFNARFVSVFEDGENGAEICMTT